MEEYYEQEQSLKSKLQSVINRVHSETVSVATIMDLIGREGLLLLCIFLTLPFMVPVSIPGVSTVFGLCIILIGVGLMTNQHPWIPAQLLRKEFPSSKLLFALEKGLIWVQRIERVSRPRLLALTQGRTMCTINGLMLLAGGVLLMAPFGFIPFSNTLPGLAILFLALGMLQRDGWCVLLGYGTNLLTVIYFGFLIIGGAVALQRILQTIGS